MSLGALRASPRNRAGPSWNPTSDTPNSSLKWLPRYGESTASNDNGPVFDSFSPRLSCPLSVTILTRHCLNRVNVMSP